MAPWVFWPSAIVVLGFVAITMIAPEWMKSTISAAGANVIDTMGWYYILLVFCFVVFSLFMGLSRFGDITLGKDEDEPEFGLVSWFAMLFAAGMGIGLVFWGVAEPLNHFAARPPGTEGGQDAVAQAAINTTFLHWGFHAWAVYIVVGLAVAYAVHRNGRPVSIRWALEPLFGDRVRGWAGNVIDVVAVVGTLFGVATSLGFGVAQVGAGLDFLGVVDNGSGLQRVLVVGITALATISVATGIGAGIKWLSNINLVLAGALMVFLLAAGPSLFVMREFVQNIGQYLQNFLGLSFRTLSFQSDDGNGWVSTWTTFYWGWWISWSPFVGIFIARISRGRTIREFVFGVMLVPTLVTFLWFSILGGTALYREIYGDGGLIAADKSVSTDTALFQLLEGYSGSGVLAGLFILLIVVFFVTSSDSGSYVVDMMTSGGDPNPPLWSRIVWAVAEGSIAFSLLLLDDPEDALMALQQMAILVAAPFSVVMILLMISTFRAAHAHHKVIVRLQRAALSRELQLEVAEGLATAGIIDAHPRELPSLFESYYSRSGTKKQTTAKPAPQDTGDIKKS
ncbi:MAG: choline transporter [Micrococcales bacterium]|nr:MAG: choline transporter [Micrococcales bacterium]